MGKSGNNHEWLEDHYERENGRGGYEKIRRKPKKQKNKNRPKKQSDYRKGKNV